MEAVLEFESPALAREFGDALVKVALEQGQFLHEQVVRPLTLQETRTIQLERGKVKLLVDPEARFPFELL